MIRFGWCLWENWAIRGGRTVAFDSDAGCVQSAKNRLFADMHNLFKTV